MDELEGGIIISSHDSCNDEGVRGVFRYVRSTNAFEQLTEMPHLVWKATTFRRTAWLHHCQCVASTGRLLFRA